jgi:hypothetical protein
VPAGLGPLRDNDVSTQILRIRRFRHRLYLNQELGAARFHLLDVGARVSEREKNRCGFTLEHNVQ